jgi:Ser/Thr protein kinase RdoA (MazF antagonist)
MYISETALKKGAELFAYDLDALHPMPQGGMPEGAVYKYTDGEDQLLIKILPTPAKWLPAARGKYDFVGYLRENGFDAPILLPSVNGNRYEVVEVEDQFYMIAKIKKAPGSPKMSIDDWDEQFFEAWGRVLGKLHALSSRYEGDAGMADWRDVHDYFADMARSDKALSSKWEQFGEELKQIPTSPDGLGLIHNDPGPWNLFFDGSTVTLVNFEVCDRHWFIYEVATALSEGIRWIRSSNRHLPDDEIIALVHNFKQHFLAGYFSENALDDSWFKYIPFFAKYRRVVIYLILVNAVGQSDDEQRKKQAAAIRESILADKPVFGLEA